MDVLRAFDIPTRVVEYITQKSQIHYYPDDFLSQFLKLLDYKNHVRLRCRDFQGDEIINGKDRYVVYVQTQTQTTFVNIIGKENGWKWHYVPGQMQEIINECEHLQVK